ncbi:hypothetical protein Bca52824_000724 [Brassica carinata]|uniref:FBD domain-containing protein n=1 Tax=Brassica carinata TaxID=52824 RepID=A0A8X8B951_BRACI|nr:hypothetical protein Bca52824_000724 [Brassica carinata]
MGCENWEFCSVSVFSLKKLTIFLDENPKSVSFDAPNLEYLEYSDNIAREYPKVNFSSLVEAHLGFHSLKIKVQMQTSQKKMATSWKVKKEKEIVGNATLICFFFLVVSGTFCCEATPVFNNLVQLTVESNSELGWDSLPPLLQNCPNLETLIFKGLVHKITDGCGNMCLCKPLKNPSCLSTSAVKVLKIILYMEIDDEGMEMEQIKQFLEKRPRLEQLVVYFNISYDPSVFDIPKKLHMCRTVQGKKKTKMRPMIHKLHPSTKQESKIPLKQEHLSNQITAFLVVSI